MPRPPRIQFASANYHVVTRGDGRRALFHDQRHYEPFSNGVRQEGERSGWIALASCWTPNDIHALIQTPEPNLASGMQHWLAGYANWYAKRNRRTGHLYQGRYMAFLVNEAAEYAGALRGTEHGTLTGLPGGVFQRDRLTGTRQ